MKKILISTFALMMSIAPLSNVTAGSGDAAAGAAFGFMSGTMFANAALNHSTRGSDLRNDINVNSQNINLLLQQIRTLEPKITGVNSKLEQKITELNFKMELIKRDIENLKNKIGNK